MKLSTGGSCSAQGSMCDNARDGLEPLFGKMSLPHCGPHSLGRVGALTPPDRPPRPSKSKYSTPLANDCFRVEQVPEAWPIGDSC